MGDIDRGVEIITAIRDRYDGLHRNPFDEAECGHHYARAMAAWSAFATLNNTHYDGRSGELTVPADRKAMWSNGSAFGTWTPGTGDDLVGEISVAFGSVALDSVVVDGVAHPNRSGVVRASEPVKIIAGGADIAD